MRPADLTDPTGIRIHVDGPSGAGLVPKRQWRSVTGQAAAHTPNIQGDAVGRKT